MPKITPKRTSYYKGIFSCLAFIITVASPFWHGHCQTEQGTQGEGAQILVLEHVGVFDSSSGTFLKNQILIIEHEKIADLYESGKKVLLPTAKVMDLSGKFVIPGLIDSHVHIASDPSGYDSRDRVEERLLIALQGGVTYVRDMAGDGRALADLVRAVKAGDIISPSIRYAALMAGPAFFTDPRAVMSAKGETPGHTPWGRAVTKETDLVLAVAEGRGTGASGIKIYAQMESDLLMSAVQEAHRQRMLVWSHATIIPSKPSDAVAAGVDVISHADHLVWEAMPEVNPRPRGLAARWLDEDVRQVSPDDPAILSLMDLMINKGTILEPTLGSYKAQLSLAKKNYRSLLPIAKDRFRFVCAVTRLAHDQGVPVCAGTDDLIDLDYSPLPNVHEEMELLVNECAFSPAEAILAATLASARALGIEKTHGTIAIGKVADLVVVAADPTVDIRHTRDIELVVKSGKVVRFQSYSD